MTSAPSMEGRGWSARLELEVVRLGQQVVPGRRGHVGPLRLQRPFYPEGPEWPHLYLLHPPGGVVGGDRLELEVRARRRASALLTTPAAQKLYRSMGPTSVQRTRIDVEDESGIEWLPAETLVFDGACARQRTVVRLASTGAFLGWEIVGLGRPASELRFLRGELGLEMEIWREGVPLFVDRLLLRGGAPELEAPWGMAGAAVLAALYCVPARAEGLSELVEAVRGIAPQAEVRAAATALDDLVVVRALGSMIEPVRRWLERVWGVLRPRVFGRAAVPPRIWSC
ncbi:MAG: urease accessory protein UreD [Pseudomonadota bacterium]